ncbi:hypothetical protein EW146_g2898 [Bondarzewia mesenterica]|uniref:Uncharacterized protein n=1 Tax=Bondarzewia mesenterica TaxID=1095465 RepID=A0A4S4M0T3_9AGAM|nr:hypothetical protein EW146_g2898 [Bondarzewia mesenterica]
MKALRKSLNASKDTHHHQISTPLPSVSKPSTAVIPPQKVIRALTSYRSSAPQELSFQKGDFFYVIRDVDHQGTWFEAHNPMTGARGLVPKAMFEEFAKGAAPSARNSQALPSAPIRSPSLRSPKTQVYYAVVMHDFVAERTDELDAKAGDPISVVAQSNREWFVAKPIGRLGKPGLIPVSFVQVRDPSSNQPIEDVGKLIDGGGLPRVEEWKKQMLNYKATSIALGILDDAYPPSPVTNSPFAPPGSIPTPPASAFAVEPSIAVQQPSPLPEQEQQPLDRPQTPDEMPEGLLLSADVVSFHFEMNEYWFRVRALYQPYDPSGSSSLPPARDLVLFRAYNDFFEYQTALLETFPGEAGREKPHPRILPYMPGPTDDVNDQLSATRREELNDYIKSLCRLNRTTARYIIEHHLTRAFLALKPGDVENEVEPQYEQMEALGWYEPEEEPVIVAYTDTSVMRPVDDVQQDLGNLKIHSNGGPHADSDGSDYGDEPESKSYGSKKPPNGKPAGLQKLARQSNGNQGQFDRGHERHGSTSSVPRGSTPESQNRLRGHAPSHSYSNSLSPLDTDPYRNSSSRSSTSSSSRWPDNSRSSRTTQATSPTSQSHSSVAGSSRSHSLVSPNNPPISANNPQTAFIKIKIFDRVSDDLIAIRVHPRVTHEQLMDKVQSRLGGKVARLSYRESIEGRGEDFVAIEQDTDLRLWLESTEKHVLYAD